MKAKLRRFWQSTGHFIEEYVLTETRSRSLQAGVLVVLELLQRLFNPPAASAKKKRRLLRRFIPALVCLAIGLFLFLPAHAQSNSSTTATRASTQQADKTNCPTDNSSTGANPPPAPPNTLDGLTGLPLPNENGNVPCPVAIATACSLPADANLPLVGLSDDRLVSLALLNGDATPDRSNAWKYTLGLAMALLAIPLILAGYQIMLGTVSSSYAGAIETISRVFLIVVIAALSLTFIDLVAGLENGIVTGLFHSLGSSLQPADANATADKWCVNVQNFFGNIFNLTAYNLQNATGTLSGTDYSQKEYATTIALINNLPADILTLLSLLLTLQMLVRIGLLGFYAVLSPLAIVGGSLPGQIGTEVMQGWMRGFLALLFVQLLQFLVLGLGSNLFPPGIAQGGSGANWFNQVMSELLPIVVMTITLGLPRLFNISSVSLLSTLSSSFGGAVTGIILIVRGF